MKKENRLRKNRYFKEVYSKGKSVANRYLVVYCLKNNKDITRIGISVNKKFGKSVERNKLKRRIREAARLSLDRVKKGYDIVVIPRKMVKGVDFNKIKGSLYYLFMKSGIIKGRDKVD